MNLNERPHGDVDYARAASHYTGPGRSVAPMAFARAMRDAFLHARARVEEWWEATANSHVLRLASFVYFGYTKVYICIPKHRPPLGGCLRPSGGPRRGPHCFPAEPTLSTPELPPTKARSRETNVQEPLPTHTHTPHTPPTHLSLTLPKGAAQPDG